MVQVVLRIEPAIIDKNQLIAGHIQGVQFRQNIPSVSTRKSRDEKLLTTEPEEEEFVVNGIYALVIGYEVLVKQ